MVRYGGDICNGFRCVNAEVFETDLGEPEYRAFVLWKEGCGTQGRQQAKGGTTADFTLPISVSTMWVRLSQCGFILIMWTDGKLQSRTIWGKNGDDLVRRRIVRSR